MSVKVTSNKTRIAMMSTKEVLKLANGNRAKDKAKARVELSKRVANGLKLEKFSD